MRIFQCNVICERGAEATPVFVVRKRNRQNVRDAQHETAVKCHGLDAHHSNGNELQKIVLKKRTETERDTELFHLFKLTIHVHRATDILQEYL